MVSVQVYVSLFLFSLIGTLTIAWIPNMINGRPADGTLGAPPVPDNVTLPEPQFYEFQLVNHFDGSDLRFWKQVRTVVYLIIRDPMIRQSFADAI